MITKYEFKNESNFEALDTNYKSQNQSNNLYESNGKKAFYDDEYKECLKLKDNMNLDAEEIKLGKEYIFFLCKYKYQYYIENNDKYKIIIKKKIRLFRRNKFRK